MASDREQALKAAEKVLKAGKKPAAVAHFRKIGMAYPEDLALHNRIGDMLCLGGLGREAVPYYEKVAFAYRDSGFMPKAVAMFKKILRQQPDSTEALVELGNLYLKQRLPGEARNYLLHAADQCVQNSDLKRAGKIYRALVDAEPEEVGHRIRLAETLAAVGQKNEAVGELLETAETIDSTGSQEDRLKILRRAMELAPDVPEPALAVARCLSDTGDTEQAMQLLDKNISGQASPGPFIQAKLKLILAGDEPKLALDLLTGPHQEAFEADDFAQVLNVFVKGPGDGMFWERIGPWLSGNGSDRAEAVLEAAVEIEQPGYVPALTLLARHLDGNGNGERTSQVLERLITTLHGKEQHEEAAGFENRLREMKPDSPILRGEEPAEEPTVETVQQSASEPRKKMSVGTEERHDFPELEAPAVPLNSADEEFVSGRLTQAEILEKYGLADKALDQVREVVERFPGHVDGQKRLIELLKAGNDKDALRDGWIGLAFAERASGNIDEARKAVTFAEATYPVEDDTRLALEAFHLIGDIPEVLVEEPTSEPAAAQTPVPEQAETVIEEITEHELIEPEDEPAKSTLTDSVEEDVVFLFDDEENKPEPLSAEPVPEPVPESVKEPDAEPAPESVKEPDAEPAPVAAKNGEEGEDLASLAAALEGELFLKEDEKLVPEAPREQSLDEVFAAFQEQVEKQVDSDDFQTHYDLGIGYREMGLLDEAIGEFERIARPGDFHREACIMVASCHRDAGRIPKAAEWYRKALDIPNDDEEAQSGLRYDLAEVLAEIGEMNEALDLYRAVMEIDPSFRDISERISQLETHLGN